VIDIAWVFLTRIVLSSAKFKNDISQRNVIFPAIHEKPKLEK